MLNKVLNDAESDTTHVDSSSLLVHNYSPISLPLNCLLSTIQYLALADSSYPAQNKNLYVVVDYKQHSAMLYLTDIEGRALKGKTFYQLE